MAKTRYKIRYLTPRTLTSVSIIATGKKERERIVRSIKRDQTILLGVEKE